MKAVKKIIFILIIILVILGAITYIDYFLAKSKRTTPNIAVKKEDQTKQMVIYNAPFYRVIHCKADNSIIFTDYKTSDNVCPRNVKYDEFGYFTNSVGIRISKRDYELMSYLNIYTFDTIDNMTTQEEVTSASYVAYQYGLSKYSIKENSEFDFENEKVELAIFQTLHEDDNTYKFIADESDQNKIYCTKLNEDGIRVFSKYDGTTCEKEFTKITMEPKWCNLYKQSTLIYNIDETQKMCES